VGTRVGYAHLKNPENKWFVVNNMSKFEYDDKIHFELGDHHNDYFCNRSTILFNWWLDDIGLTNFEDEMLQEPLGGQSMSIERERDLSGKEIQPHELQECTTADLQQTRKLEVRMPNTEYVDWELLCLEMQMPEGIRNHTRGTMVRLSQPTAPTLYSCEEKETAAVQPASSSSKHSLLDQKSLEQENDLKRCENLLRDQKQPHRRCQPREDNGRTDLDDLISDVSFDLSKAWTQEAADNLELVLEDVLEPLCGAPFSISDLQSMDDQDWEEDVGKPLKDSGFVGSFRAKMIVKSMRRHELVTGK